MYFAGNAVTTSIVGAVSGSLVYEYIKNLFVSKQVGGFVWASDSFEAYRALHGLAADAEITAAEAATVYNFGNLVVPFIVCVTCIVGFFLAFKLPRDFTPAVLARRFKELDPTLDISEMEAEEVKPEREEIIFVQVGLTVLSGFIFGFIWCGFLLKSVRVLTGKVRTLPLWLLACLVPFGQIAVIVKLRRVILDKAAAEGKQVKLPLLPMVLLSCLFFILPLNIVVLAMLQNAVNRLNREETAPAEAEAVEVASC
jgi:hypothetical protein